MPKTHLEHFQYKYSPSRDSLFVQIGEPVAEISTPLNEARRAARLSYRDAQVQDQPVWLCLSGGIDSECMAQAFVFEKIPFKVAILRFTSMLNDYDIAAAIEFCRRHQIEFEYFDFDILNFFENGKFFEIAKKYRCRSPQLTVHLELLRMIDGFPVMAWNPTSLQWIDYPGGKLRMALPSELHLSYHRFLDITQKGGVGFFFAYTPELFYSFFHTPTMRKILHQQGEQLGLCSSYLSKTRAYQEGGFQVNARVDKFTGFEKIKQLYADRYRSDLSLFDRIFRAPLELLYPDPPHHYAKVSRRYLPSAFPGF